MNTKIPDKELIQRLWDSSSCPAVWATVVGTPGVGVALLRCDGRFMYCSGEFKRLFLGDPEADAEGRALTELFPGEWARERMGFLSRIERGEPAITVREIWRGKQLLTRVGLLPWREDGCALACIVTRPANASELAALEGKLVCSTLVELGDLSVLTPRELAVLALVGEGLTLKEIAERLHRSFKTIDNHRASIGRKLNESDRVGLSRLALEAGLTLGDSGLKRVSFFRN